MTGPTALLLLLPALLLQAPAFAQGRRGPQEGSSLGLASEFSGREGFGSRSAGFSSAFTAGRLCEYGLRLSADAAHLRHWGDRAFPPELYETAVALRAAGPAWSFGAGARSNSDRPYGGLTETDLSLDALRPLKRKGPHSLMLGFSYSSRRSFLRGVPLPYLSYSYMSQRLSVFLPFSVKWRPGAGAEVSASYFPPKYFSLSCSQKVHPALTLEISGGLRLKQYLLSGRADKDTALYLEQPHAGLRARYAAAGFEFSPWYARGFRGRYFTGKSYDDHRRARGTGAGPLGGLDVSRKF